MADPFDLHRERRGLFDGAAETYDAGRPGYPDRVYELLRDVCGLGPGCRVVEIGPGTGQATGRLLAEGAEVRAVELGAGLARRLADRFPGERLAVDVGAFEDVELEPASCDLVVAATSFHWVPPGVGVARCADVLRPGGWLALWWNHFGDASRPDPFADAVGPLLAALAPELADAAGGGTHPHPLDVGARVAEIAAEPRFGPVRHELVAWSGDHDPAGLRAMFASFSPVLALPPERRAATLDAVEPLARADFGGTVVRPYLTPVYLAPRA